MDISKKIRQLQERIDNSILPLITSDYVFWGLPYYINPGDTLIWEGTLQLLKKCKYKCLNTCGWDSFETIPLKKDTVIIIIGGGFFGDVWRKAWNNVIKAIIHYPNNPIIILPQSIYYENAKNAEQDAIELAKLSKLTICTRDQQSYDYGKSIFHNNVILVPDMAFYCEVNKLRNYSSTETDRILFLKRKDKELPNRINVVSNIIKDDRVEESDWPPMCGKSSVCMRMTNKLIQITNKVPNHKIRKHLVDALFLYFNRKIVIYDAVKFLSPYKKIYTTRLHVMILGFILGKEICILDNSYGKISSCYKTWLSDIDNVYIMEVP